MSLFKVTDQIRTFQTPIPYRVVQKRKSDADAGVVILLLAVDRSNEAFKDAPYVLSVLPNTTIFSPMIGDFLTALNASDEVLVTRCLVRSDTSSIVTDSDDGYRQLVPAGIVLDATIGFTAPRWQELAFVTAVQTTPEGRFISVSIINKGVEEQVDFRLFRRFTPRELTRGSLIRINMSLMTAGTHISSRFDLSIPPECLQYFKPDSSIVISSNTRWPTSVRVVQFNEIQPEEINQYLLASSAFFENLHTPSALEQLPSCEWNLSKPHHAQVICKYPIIGPELHENQFTPGSAVKFIRYDTNAPEIVFEPVYVKVVNFVTSPDASATVMVQIVANADVLVKKWNLSSMDELITGRYRILCSDESWHLEPFMTRLRTENDYFPIKSCENSFKSRILYTLLPNDGHALSSARYFRPSPKTAKNQNHITGDLSEAQFQVIENVVQGSPVVVLDGVCKTGKTEALAFSVPGILRDIVRPSEGCLLLTAGCLSSLTECMVRIEQLIDQEVLDMKDDLRILDLTKKSGKNSILAAMEKLDRTTLSELESSVIDDFLREKSGNVTAVLGADASFGKTEAATTESSCLYNIWTAETKPILTSDLDIVISVIEVVVRNFKPHLIVAVPRLAVSVLPAFSPSITHLVIDDAGLFTAYDALVLVAECPNIQQLFLCGNGTQNPVFATHAPTIVRSPNPAYFTSVLRLPGCRLSPDVDRHEFVESFYLQNGIVGCINMCFYGRERLMPIQDSPWLIHPELNSEMPILFDQCVGIDRTDPISGQHFNVAHSERAVLAVKMITESNRGIKKIAVLCYYEAQCKHIRKLLKKQNLHRKTIVDVVDAFYGNTACAVVLVTTRNARQRIPVISKEVDLDGKSYIMNDLVSIEQVPPFTLEELNEYADVFNGQRLLLALSRAEYGCVIIGSCELLREDVLWMNLLRYINDSKNFITDADRVAAALKLAAASISAENEVEVEVGDEDEDEEEEEIIRQGDILIPSMSFVAHQNIHPRKRPRSSKASPFIGNGIQRQQQQRFQPSTTRKVALIMPPTDVDVDVDDFEDEHEFAMKRIRVFL